MHIRRKDAPLFQDQRGITLFEIMIILLLMLLIGLSCAAIVHRVHSDAKRHEEKVKTLFEEP